jgi:hypothetical protein
METKALPTVLRLGHYRNFLFGLENGTHGTPIRLDPKPFRK